ncbi:hypothetical protein DM860_010499 [Cuscuta australis]|uniref:Inositol monophosphatase n=1 Tax=Cuscuta australis TaxID=267555 RepID=A0A328E5R3_9ASTE|nr:hypothetical protein DM860_010499 [Cuscuta australis]
MVTFITESLPTHVVFTEETGFNHSSNQSPFVWVLDAINGVREDFFAGFNLFSFGTMIALLYNGKPILGFIDQPIRKLRWMGVKGKPTTLNQEEVVAVACDDLSMAYANLKQPNTSDDARVAFNRLCYKVYVVLLDTTSTTYGALACGQLHLVADCDVSPWNVLAAVPIVEGAGGVITDWEGHELLWDACQIKRGTIRVVAASDKKTHQEVIDSLSY